MNASDMRKFFACFDKRRLQRSQTLLLMPLAVLVATSATLTSSPVLAEETNTMATTQSEDMDQRRSAEALVQKLFSEVVNQGNLTLLGDLYHERFVDHAPGPGQAPGVKGIEQAVERYRTAIPDLHINVEQIFLVGDHIIVREKWTGKLQQKLMDIEPNNMRFEAIRVHIFRIEDGRIIEEWTAGSVYDRLKAQSTDENPVLCE